MKIAIVGPTHPYKGGIALHTTQLAHHLKAEGHEVELISWRSQYPFFYPGQQQVPSGTPEMPVFDNTRRVLSWKNPVGWLSQARHLKKFDKVIFVWWVPMIQGPVYLAMLAGLGRSRPETILLCHNIVSHSASPIDRLFTKRVFKAVDKLIVHTKALAAQASKLTNRPVTVADMPAHLPGKPTTQPNSGQLNNHLLFFGLVRHYKGVDILIKALARIPDIKLTIAGEMWGKQEVILRQLIHELNLENRVKLMPGYVPAESIAPLFATADALVMPYRSGTASQNVELAFAYGRPVIATLVGSMPNQINDKFNGLLCAADDVESLAETIKYFYQPGIAQRLIANIEPINPETDWPAYIKALTPIKYLIVT